MSHFHVAVAIVVAGTVVGYPPDDHPPGFADRDTAMLAASREADRLARAQGRPVDCDTRDDGYTLGWVDDHGDPRGRIITVEPCDHATERTNVA